MSYRILGAALSPFVRKVRVLCAEKGIAYDLDPVNPFAPPPDFERVSPLKRIPVLAVEEEGVTSHLPDSSVICAYLERRHPDRPLFPAEPLALGRALWYEEYGDTELVSVIGPGVFQPVVLARLLGREPDAAKAEETVRERLPRLFDYLEGELIGKRFLVDDTFTIADIGIASPLVNLQHAGYDVDATRWPALAAHLGRVLERESFSAAIDGERRALRQ